MKEARLTSFAAARSVFYPLAWDQGPQLMKSSTNIASMITPSTLSIHLWNETLHRYLDKAERGSPLDRLLRHGVLFDEGAAAGFGR